ncbi:ABC transporter substrate-binding protein [Succinispira mobilis]|uniref:ABC transporter substrate-binding protein n=1 Tax=Succinispira mobilis TaxID=78120 RepID=UPI0003751E91|nr:ABC transporter substrate-binding protein [Succinispira mobilis]
MPKYLRYIIIIFALVAISLTIFLATHSEGKIFAKKAVDKRLVTDSIGRQLQIPQHPQRVVALNASNLELYYAAGGTVVGKPLSSALPLELVKATQEVPAVGIIHSPDVEKILALKPDLVLGIDIPFHHNLIDILAKADIPIIINSLDKYEDVLQTLDFYGELTNKKSLAAQKKQAIETQYQQILAQIQGEKVPKSLIIWGSPASFSMATNKSFSGDLVNRLGGGNIADAENKLNTAFVPLSMEYITAKDPEVIFLITHGSEEKVLAKFRQELSTNPIWQNISAVKNTRVYQLPAPLFSVNPGTQVGESLQIIANYLYTKEKK